MARDSIQLYIEDNTYLKDGIKESANVACGVLCRMGQVGSYALYPFMRLISSLCLPKVIGDLSQSIVKKIEQAITNTPTPLLALNMCSGVVMTLIFGLQAISAVGIGIGAFLIGGVCEMALRHANINDSKHNQQAHILMGIGAFLSPLMLITPFNWMGFTFGLGQGLLWSSLSMGIGSSIHVT